MGRCLVLLLCITSSVAFVTFDKPRRNGFASTRINGSSNDGDPPNWKKLSTMVQINTPWMKLVGERLLDDNKNELEYWRVEKADSLVVVTKHGNNFVFPRPMYRPGIGRSTLDFPGGRVAQSSNLDEVATSIVCRELNMSTSCIQSISPLNEKGWPINSSFSNQRLFGYVAVLRDETQLDPDVALFYKNSEAGLDGLLDDLDCLQCRHVLLEYLRSRE